MIHRVEIEFLVVSLEHLRLEREQIIVNNCEQILLDLEQLTSDTSCE